ncbi:MAG TPA: TonB-dependent receptor [Vicinamibacterales bacterium]|nr:TonB-dependent receptor [Vicinamibacterales bacterium]
MRRYLFRPLAIGLALAMAMGTTAGAQSLSELSLEDLMRLDAGRVFGASERSQPVTEAPSSVSFITAEDIARYGYKTLADILHGVRGLYVSDERNFSSLGARGFGKPGDYNSRILLLVNGHRVNDNVFGQAAIGAEFGLDPATFERVEIIRGPASSLYGESAFFAVVNVITRTGSAIDGSSVTYETGSNGTQMVRGMMGDRLSNGVDYAVSATVEGSEGVHQLYFPEFDSPETNNGVAEGLDGYQFGQYYGRLNYGSLTFTGAYGRRRKDIPTASFGTLFNEQIDREQMTDRHTLFDVEYARPVGASRVTLRGAYDRFTSNGYYPYDGEPFGQRVVVGANDVVGSSWTIGGRVTRPLPRQMLILGAEYIDNVDQNYTSGYAGQEPIVATQASSSRRALFLQDEIKLGTHLILNAGLRYDGYKEFDRVTPRTALIFMPSAHQSFKYLYGNAFRAPNIYEKTEFYFGPDVATLGPESIDTHEVVWERYTGDWLRTSVSSYWYKADNLITLKPTDDPSAFLGVTYVNEGEVRAKGLEFEAQMRLWRGADGHMSYAVQEAIDQATGATLPNSPRQMGKVRVSAPLFGTGSSLAVEVLGIGRRQTLSGNWTGAATTANVTLVKPLGRSLELFGTVRNLFDVDYAVPASSEHVQDTIPQNGRTFRVGLRVRLPL